MNSIVGQRHALPHITAVLRHRYHDCMQVQPATDRRSFLLALSAAAAGCSQRAASGYSGYAFVANEQSRSIAAVNLATFRMAREIALDGHPTAVLTRGRRPEVYALT